MDSAPVLEVRPVKADTGKSGVSFRVKSSTLMNGVNLAFISRIVLGPN